MIGPWLGCTIEPPCRVTLVLCAVEPTDVLSDGFVCDIAVRLDSPTGGFGAADVVNAAKGAVLSAANVAAHVPMAAAKTADAAAGKAKGVVSSSAATIAGGMSKVANAGKSRFASKAAGKGKAVEKAVNKAGASTGSSEMGAAEAAAEPRAAPVQSDEMAPNTSPMEQAEEYLRKQYPCCGSRLIKCLPTWWKAQMPFDVPDNWMPDHLREKADEIVTIHTHVELILVFDPDTHSIAFEFDPPTTDDTEKTTRNRRSVVNPLAAPKPAGPPREPVRFQLQLTGKGCWPTLGQLAVRRVTFRANCICWWEVFEQRVSIAFARTRA